MSTKDALHRLLHPDDDGGEASYGHPSPGAVMSRGGGELGEAHDHEREELAPQSFGSPNDTILEHVRPPLS